MKDSILFVDDNENILQGLRRNLRPMHQEWECSFATSGEDALKLMQDRHIDVVVSDMRMPGMDGATFLSHVKEAHGHTARFVLSGQCEEEVILQLLSVSHQYMAKPFEHEKIISTIRGILSLKAMLQDNALKTFVTNLSALPSLPSLHESVLAELNAAAPSTKALEDIFLRDISILAKLLQIMNSSYFGPSQDINTIAYVWELLSLEKIRTLITQDCIVSPLNKDLEKDPFIPKLWQRSLVAARIARALAKAENAPPKMADKAFVAGLLHAIGTLVLYEYQRKEKGGIDYKGIQVSGVPDNYALVGGWLLTLWGLPHDICFAVLNHATPDKFVGTEGDKDLLSIVHVATAWALAREAPELSHLNEDFLRQTGAYEKLESWKISSALI